MNSADPEYLRRQYTTDAGLAIRIDTHRRYGVGPDEDIFTIITRTLADRSMPEKVLDVGAGTGNWYHAIRSQLPATVHYAALDQSAGMVARLREAAADDPLAEIRQGDAQALPWPDGTFDWVGAHFMLYHVPDIRAAVREAARVLRPGGFLAAATNSARPYRELWELGEWAAQRLGITGAATGSETVRFNLTSGGTFFPSKPERVEWPNGFRFEAPSPALRYLESGPLRSHLGPAADNPALVEQARILIADRIAAAIEREGAFVVHSWAGFFLWQKPEETGR